MENIVLNCESDGLKAIDLLVALDQVLDFVGEVSSTGGVGNGGGLSLIVNTASTQVVNQSIFIRVHQSESKVAHHTITRQSITTTIIEITYIVTIYTKYTRERILILTYSIYIFTKVILKLIITTIHTKIVKVVIKLL